MNTTDVPKHGMLEGVKVLCMCKAVGTSVTSSLLSEHGATVINSELPGGDSLRSMKYAFEQEHRNQLGLAFNMRKPGGDEIFNKLIAWADIWVEASKGDMLDKFGLTDEKIWEINPKLVIVHVSGFGHTGDPDYVPLISYDAIGQAFGGFMAINGDKEPSTPLASPNVCDEFTGVYGAMAAMFGYYSAQRTGKGESIDLAQFEVMVRAQYTYPAIYLNDGMLLPRIGNGNASFKGYGAYKCLDGKWMFVGVSGVNIIARAKGFFGLGDDPDFPEGLGLAYTGTPAAEKLENAIIDYCATTLSDEVQDEMRKLDVPCSKVYDLSELAENSHYLAREVWAEWDDPKYGKMKGFNILPKATVHKPRIWRGAPKVGMDTYDLLREFGYGDEQIRDLESTGTVQTLKED
jgi:L-carnitine CoA-transferase/bile acid-CoA hydrolase